MAGVRRPVTTIKEQVYQIIKEDICNGVYPPGRWLQETELSASLQVSRSPIREALRQLVSDGLVVEYPNRGVFVKEYTQKDIEDVFDLRTLLESYAILRSGQHITTAHQEKLLACMDTLTKYYEKGDLESYIKEDTRLHQLIIELGGNSLVMNVYERVYSMVQQFRIYSLLSKERFDESVGEHTKIIENLLAGNAREAERINKRHLILAREKIVEYLNSKKKEDEAKDKEDASK